MRSYVCLLRRFSQHALQKTETATLNHGSPSAPLPSIRKVTGLQRNTLVVNNVPHAFYKRDIAQGQLKAIYTHFGRYGDISTAFRGSHPRPCEILIDNRIWDPHVYIVYRDESSAHVALEDAETSPLSISPSPEPLYTSTLASAADQMNNDHDNEPTVIRYAMACDHAPSIRDVLRTLTYHFEDIQDLNSMVSFGQPFIQGKFILNSSHDKEGFVQSFYQAFATTDLSILLMPKPAIMPPSPNSRARVTTAPLFKWNITSKNGRTSLQNFNIPPRSSPTPKFLAAQHLPATQSNEYQPVLHTTPFLRPLLQRIHLNRQRPEIRARIQLWKLRKRRERFRKYPILRNRWLKIRANRLKIGYGPGKPPEWMLQGKVSRPTRPKNLPEMLLRWRLRRRQHPGGGWGRRVLERPTGMSVPVSWRVEEFWRDKLKERFVGGIELTKAEREKRWQEMEPVRKQMESESARSLLWARRVEERQKRALDDGLTTDDVQGQSRSKGERDEEGNWIPRENESGSLN